MKKFLIKVNGTAYEVEVEEVMVDGATKPVEVARPAAPVAAAAPAAAPVAKAAAPKNAAVPAGAATVTAPMPGTILKVNVGAGDTVKKGQVLLILEAMKMENELVSPADGKVVSVNVEKGKSVSVGEVLVTIA